MKFLSLLGIGALSILSTFVANWIALAPWRKTRKLHWTEQARTYYPARVGAVGLLWIAPAAFALGAEVLLSDEAPHWAMVAIVASWGAAIGTLPMDREVFPRIPLARLMREAATSWLTRFLMWFVLVGAAALMPETFGWPGILIAAIVLVLLVTWNLGGWIFFFKKIGVMIPAPPRLQQIVDQTAASMNVGVTETLLMRSSLAQAFAIPGTKQLLFTERLLEILSDEEIGSVCAHELGHLMEKRSQYLQRHVIWLMFFPWIFISPLCHTFGTFGFFGLLILTWLVPPISRNISHALEKKADQFAIEHQNNPRTYARALTKLYEDGLFPAVSPKNQRTHPHLYDRLIEAGVTPDFPRPAAASSLALQTLFFSLLVGIFAAQLLFRN